MEDWEERYKEFWRPLLTTDGHLDEGKIKNELHDLNHIMRQVPKVYDHVTGGLLSKPMYDADTVIQEHDRVCHEYCVDKDDHTQEIARAVEEERERKITEDYGFRDLVAMAQRMLDQIYPEEVFDGSSGDVGAFFVSKLRDALASLKEKKL